MSMSLLKVFTSLIPNYLDVMSQFNQMLFKNCFYIRSDEGNNIEVLLAITKNYLLTSQNIQGQQINNFCPINFDLKFQVLRQQWPNQKTPGIPFGIRFQKGPNNDAIQFYHNSPIVLQQLISILSKKINQRNFHKLFKAKKKIGKGAFATVYLAQRLIDNKMVAVKAFSKQKQFSSDKGKQSLQNQIRIMRTIEHSNVTALEEVYETQNSIYVILQYLEGKQLNDDIKSGHRFSLQQSSIIIKQILQGLQHLDKKKIIHRDLKPQNIMFKKQNSLQLGICDFGLATLADQNKYLFVRCGTAGFVAPEIINIKDMTTKSEPISDVFSAGVIFHILLIGYSIFPGKKYNDVLAQNRNCEFNFKSQQYQKLPSSALTLLISMLQKDPKKRISAQQALNLEFFKINHNKYTNRAMDIQQQVPKQKYPLMQINLNQIDLSNKFNNNSLFCEKMDDQNQKKENKYLQSIGQSINKKLSFSANPNSYRKSERKN